MEEIKQLIEKVGGKMTKTEGEARALVHQVRRKKQKYFKIYLRLTEMEMEQLTFPSLLACGQISGGRGR